MSCNLLSSVSQLSNPRKFHVAFIKRPLNQLHRNTLDNFLSGDYGFFAIVTPQNYCKQANRSLVIGF